MTNKNSETPFENIHSRIVDFADNTFLGDKRTLEEIRKDRQKIIDEAKRKQEEATEELKKTTTSKVLRGAISGPIKAVNETVEFADDIYDHFAGNPYDNNDLIDLKEIGLEVEGDKEDWTYTMPQAVSQFLIPMGLVSGTTRKVITNPWVRGAVAGAVADFVVQDPYEENLFNMLDNHPTLANPITDLLKAKTEEEIGVAEARLRQAAGGMVIGETLTGLIRGAGKGFTKLSKETQKRILTRLTNDQNTKLVYAASDDIDNLGDEIIPDSPKIGTQIPRGETAQSGAVFIERVDKTNKELIGEQKGIIDKTMARLVLANEQLPKTYDLAVLELQELNATQLAELGIKKADIAKLSPRKTINLLKKNFDNVRKDLLPGEYRMEGYSESRRKLYKKWFKDDPDINWVDRQTGKASTIDDEMSIPYLTVKDQPVDAGSGGGAVPPRKPPSGSGADVPPVDPTDPKVQTTFNPKFVVNNLILEEAEKIKIADASGQWPLKRTFKDISNKANKQTIQKTIATATEFNKEYGRTGDKDLAATVVAMNRLLNKNAQDLHRLSTSMSQSLDAKNIESFKSIRTDFENQIAIIDGLITLNKPLKTIPAQTLAANKIGGGVADTAATIDDLAKRTPTDKAVNQASDLRGVVDEGSEETIKDETLKELLDLVEKGDKAAIKQVRVLTNRLQALSGNPEGLRRMMAEGIPLKALRVFNEVWINNILSGPTTHAVNILSTGMNTIARPFDQIIGAGSINFRKDINIGFKESLFKNRGNLTFNPHFDTKKAVRGGKELIYLMSSIGDSLKMARAAFRIEDNIIDPGRMIQDGGSRFAIRHDGEGAIAGLVNGYGATVRLSGRLLLSEDEFFKSLNFRAYTKASAWENGVNKGLKGKELTDYIQDQFDRTIAIVNTGSMKNTKSIEIAELYEKAKQYAADVTFTSDLQPGSLGSKVQNLASHPVARQFLPFVRTPMNIFKAQVRRTPGFNLMLQEYRQALKSSDTAVAARARGEMITGGALWSVGALVAGNIDDDFAEFTFTGGGPKDLDLLNQRKETGWQPYSFRTILKDKDGNIKMGKDGKPRYKYVSFKRFEPWASHLMLMADFASIIGQLHPQDRMDVGTAISAAIGRNLTDKTYLQGITELGYLLSDFDYGQKWLARRATQTIVPFSGLAKTVSKTLDPRIKDTRPKAGDEEMLILRQFFNELKATVHGYGDLKPLRNFITGSIIDYPPGFGPDIFNFMNPIRETKSRNHAVLTVLDDVGIIIPKPSDTIKPIQTGGIQIEGGIKLDHNQYADYLKEIASIKGSDGITLVRALYNKMQNPQIKVLISTAKGEDITGENQDTSVELREIARDTLDSEFKEIIARYKDAARKSFLRKNPDILVDYEKLRAELNNKFQQSSLEKLEKLTGVSN